MRESLQLFEPRAGVLYSLDATAELTGLTRREVLVYCRYGVVRPHTNAPFGMLGFDATAIRLLRQARELRRQWAVSAAAASLILQLHAEVERLQRELDFWRRPR